MTLPATLPFMVGSPSESAFSLTTETLTVNNVPLHTYAKSVETLKGRLVVPARRGENLVLPGRHGRVTYTKRFDQGTIVLSMWVKGCTDLGAIPGGSNSRIEFFKRVDELSRLFTEGQLVTLEHTLPDGTKRRVTAETAETIDFSTRGRNPLAKFAVTLVTPEPFWRDIAPVSQIISGAGTFGLENFAAGSAPMDDLSITFTGPCSNPQVIDQPTGITLRYNHVFSAGQSVTIHCNDWSLSGGGGHVPDYRKLYHYGDPRWFVLSSAALPSVVISQTGAPDPGFTTAFSGYRKFLVG